MNYLSKNIKLLSIKNKALAHALTQSPKPIEYQTVLSKSKQPTLIKLKDNGDKIFLHSAYDPQKEAANFIESKNLKNSLNYIITGFGLGYHISELIKHASSKAHIFVIEKEIEILRIAFETVDLESILKHPSLLILLNPKKTGLLENLENTKTELAFNGYTSINFKSLVESNRDYYESLDVTFQQILQETRVNINTRCTFSRLYYQNYLENLSSFAVSPGITDLAGKTEGIPGIIVSAGPSLDKNIQLLQRAKDRTLIVAVATALNALLSNGITPDFVIAIDADDTSIQSFNLNLENISFKLIYDPCLPSSIVNSYPGNRFTFDSNLFISQWTSRFLKAKGHIGKSLSVAHTAYLFTRILGCNPIILTGQDLAFDKIQLHCRNSYFENLFKDISGFGTSIKDLRNNHFYKYRNSIKQTLDIFGGKITTTTAMDSYKNLFAEEFQKTGMIYNATEGGSGIPGTISITLREAINRFCSKPCNESKKKLTNIINRRESLTELAKNLDQKISAFIRWQDHLSSIKRQLSQNNTNKFTDEMNSFYQDFLKDEDAVRLIQEYAYKGFLNWNKVNNQLAILEEKTDGDKITSLKTTRDKEFLLILLNALKDLEKKFKSALKDIHFESNKKY